MSWFLFPNLTGNSISIKRLGGAVLEEETREILERRRFLNRDK
jgi:hypothetical protein